MSESDMPLANEDRLVLKMIGATLPASASPEQRRPAGAPRAQTLVAFALVRDQGTPADTPGTPG